MGGAPGVNPAADARDSSTRSSASETLVPTDFVRSARFTRHLRRSLFKAPHLFSKAVMREGRTDSVRPRLTDRLAAKDKTLPRVLDGYSAHPRTPNMCFGRARLQRAFSFRRYLRQEVALQQPKVAAQLPTGGDVSCPCPCRRYGAFRWPRQGCRRKPQMQQAAPKDGSQLRKAQPHAPVWEVSNSSKSLAKRLIAPPGGIRLILKCRCCSSPRLPWMTSNGCGSETAFFQSEDS